MSDEAAIKPLSQVKTVKGNQVKLNDKAISLGRKAANLRRLENTQTSASPLMAGASKEAIGANKGPDMGRVKAANAAISPKGYAIEQAADDRPVVKGPGSKGLPKGRSMSRDLEWNNGTSMKGATLKLQGGAAMKDPFNAAARTEDQSAVGKGDLGELEPGATKAQASRGRSLAASIRENRSSIQSHQHPVESDLGNLHGDMAVPKSPDTFGSQNKDLGRVVAKAARGETAGEQPGLLKAATARANAGRSIANIEGVMDAPKQSLASSLKAKFGGAARGGGTVLGAYGTVTQAIKASEAYQGMKRGEAVNPITLDTIKPKVGDTILTPQGKKKIRSVPTES